MKKVLIAIIGIILLIIIIATTVVLTLMISNSQNQSTVVDTNNSNGEQDIEETGDQSITTPKCEIDSGKKDADEEMYSYEYTYPVFTCSDEQAEEDLNTFVKNAVDVHISSIEEGVAGMKSFGSAEFDVIQNNEDYVSVRINYSDILGGGTGDSGIVAVNYDLSTNKFMGLEDLFEDVDDYVVKVSEKAISTLKDQLGDSGNDAQIEAGAGANADNFQTFVFEEEGVTFVFNKYQVGPGALGNPEVYILFSEIQ